MPDTVRKAARMAGLIAVRKNDGDSSGIGNRQCSGGRCSTTGGRVGAIFFSFSESPIKLCRSIAVFIASGRGSNDALLSFFAVFLGRISCGSIPVNQ